MPATLPSAVRPITASRGTAVAFAAALALAAFSHPAFSAPSTEAAPPTETSQSTKTAQPASPPKTLSLDALEQRVTAQGIRVKEMKVRGLLLKVEGRDQQHRKVKLVLDRRTGEVLYRGFDD